MTVGELIDILLTLSREQDVRLYINGFESTDLVVTVEDRSKRTTIGLETTPTVILEGS